MAQSENIFVQRISGAMFHSDALLVQDIIIVYAHSLPTSLSF